MCVAILSCSEEDASIETIVTTADLTISIDENPDQETIIGTVTGVSSTGTVSFSITSQSPNGALTINETTGELTILDITLFDFETNPTITAIVEVVDGNIKESADVTVNLNDVIEKGFIKDDHKKHYLKQTY